MNATKPRLLISTETAPPFTSGVATAVDQIAKHLGDWEVLILAPDMAYESLSGRPVLGLPSIKVPLYTDLRVVLPQYPGVRSKISSTLDTFKPDVIMTMGGAFLALATAALGKERGIPIVGLNDTDLMAYSSHYGLDKLSSSIGMLTRWLHRFNTMTLVASPSYRQRLEGIGFKDLRQWRLGIDTQDFSPAYKSTELREQVLEHFPDTELICLVVSRLAAEKSIDQLLPIAQLPRVALVVVGDGPAKAILEDHFEGTQTLFLGRKDNSDHELSKIFASADVFLSASVTETFGLSVLEATASGLPSVIIEGNGTRDIVVDGKTGYICQSPTEMVKRVKQLRDDTELRAEMAEAARKESLTYSWKIVIQELEDILWEAIKMRIPA